MNAAAWPPLPPTLRTVTAGFAVGAVALEKSVATLLAPFSVQRSATPWYWIVSPTMPAPGARGGVDLQVAVGKRATAAAQTQQRPRAAVRAASR